MEKYNNTKVLKAIGAESRKLYDTSCVFCLTHGRQTQGQFHCKYCGVLCEECAAHHQKLPKKGHWAARLKMVVQPPPEAPTFESFKKCEYHPGEKINKYCIDCGELVCNACLGDKHDECAMESMDSMTRNMVRDKEMHEARLELEEARVRNNKARKGKMEELKKMAKQADAFVDKVLAIRQKINALFDSLLEIIMRDKNTFCNAEAEIIEEYVFKSKKIIPVFNHLRQSLDEAYMSNNNTYLWIAIKKMQNVIVFYDKFISEMGADKCEVRFEFVPSQSLTNLLQDPENIGTMKITSSRIHSEERKPTTRPQQMHRLRKSQTVYEPSTNTPRTLSKIPKLPAIKSVDNETSLQLKVRPMSRSTNRSKSMNEIHLKPNTGKLTSRARTNTSIYLNSNTPRLYTRKKISSKKLQLEDDVMERQLGEMFGEMRDIKLSNIGKKEIAIPEESLQNCITGSTYLMNGRLVLVDYNNKNLKVYTSEFQLKTCFLLEERPWDVAACLRTDVAVSYPFVNTIEIIETSPEVKVNGKITTDRKCHGLAFQRKHKLLYVACGEGVDARIHAYDLDGYIRRVIIPEIGVLHEPCFLTMSPNGDSMFVSDLDNGIVGFDTDSGALICQYKDEKVKRYWDLTADLHGHVFVLTTDSDCLYVLMGEHNGHFLTTFEGDKKVCALCFDPITNNLVVSRWQSDEIEMFRVVYN